MVDPGFFQNNLLAFIPPADFFWLFVQFFYNQKGDDSVELK